MNENCERRDRAFDRVVVIDAKDKARMEAILSDIPRDDAKKQLSISNGKAMYVLKVKKQELLMIKLAIETKSVSKIKRAKKTYKSLNF